jgi:DNA-binding MarR family transcriptional regulator
MLLRNLFLLKREGTRLMNTNDISDDYFLVSVPLADGETDRETMSFSRTPQILLAHAANRTARVGGENLKKDPGSIGTVDFKVLVMLARYPGSSVKTASDTIGIDKGAVSRSLAKLERDGVAIATCERNDDRRKNWRLTVSGYDLHDQLVVNAIKFQKELLKGFDLNEVKQLNAFLHRILHNIDVLDGKVSKEADSA